MQNVCVLVRLMLTKMQCIIVYMFISFLAKFYTTFMRIIVHTTGMHGIFSANVCNCALFIIKCTTTKVLGCTLVVFATEFVFVAVMMICNIVSVFCSSFTNSNRLNLLFSASSIDRLL